MNQAIKFTLKHTHLAFSDSPHGALRLDDMLGTSWSKFASKFTQNKLAAATNSVVDAPAVESSTNVGIGSEFLCSPVGTVMHLFI